MTFCIIDEQTIIYSLLHFESNFHLVILQRAGFVPYNTKIGTSSSGNCRNAKTESSITNNSRHQSLKLFGQTMLVSMDEVPSKSNPDFLERKDDLDLQRHISTDLVINCGVCFGSASDTDIKGMDSSDEQISSEMGTNSSCLTRNQRSPSVVSNYPRHVPVQCIVDGSASVNSEERSRNFSIKTEKSYSASSLNASSSPSSVSSSDSISPWLATIPAIFPWPQMQQGDRTVGDAVAAAAAAASACWSLYGVVPPFCHPNAYFGLSDAEHPCAHGTEPLADSIEIASSPTKTKRGDAESLYPLSDECRNGRAGTPLNLVQTEERNGLKMEAGFSNERSSNASCSSDVANKSSLGKTSLKERETSKRSLSIAAPNEFQSEKYSDMDDELEGERMSKRQCQGSKPKAEADDDSNCISSKSTGASSEDGMKILYKGEGFEHSDLGSKEISCSPNDSVSDTACNVNVVDARVDKAEQTSGVIAQSEDLMDTEEMPHELSSLSDFRGKALNNWNNRNRDEPLEVTADKVLPNFARAQKSGMGFVPYQRCSMQAWRVGMHSQSEMLHCEERVVDGNPICSKH
eukprot:TRINITY_DN3633_c0_g1_i2.p1 TRINITY_DN3633_c0_g1~~TRINITY_DN3633_c0_g1_i2.p1  ORF type:complete len:575 (+),score=97.28 TRINITY_DN3633_c0_g1_i2:30-1754(+)